MATKRGGTRAHDPGRANEMLAPDRTVYSPMYGATPSNHLVTLRSRTWIWLGAACVVAVLVVCGTTWGIQQAYFDKTCDREETVVQDSAELYDFVRGMRDAATAVQGEAALEGTAHLVAASEARTSAYSQGQAFAQTALASANANPDLQGRRLSAVCGKPFVEYVLTWTCAVDTSGIKWNKCGWNFKKETRYIECPPIPAPKPGGSQLWQWQWQQQGYAPITSAERFVWGNVRGW